MLLETVMASEASSAGHPGLQSLEPRNSQLTDPDSAACSSRPPGKSRADMNNSVDTRPDDARSARETRAPRARPRSVAYFQDPPINLRHQTGTRIAHDSRTTLVMGRSLRNLHPKRQIPRERAQVTNPGRARMTRKRNRLATA